MGKVSYYTGEIGGGIGVTRVEVWNFVALLGAAFATAYAIFYQLPMLARATYQHRLSALRDRAVDATIGGRLPTESDCVEAFIHRCEVMADDARGLTLLRGAFVLRAIHRSSLDLDAYAKRLMPSYKGLAPAERSLMHAFDREFDAATRAYILNGSPAGWLLHGLLGLLRTVAAKRDDKIKSKTQMLDEKLESRTETLAKDYSEAVISRSNNSLLHRRRRTLAHT